MARVAKPVRLPGVKPKGLTRQQEDIWGLVEQGVAANQIAKALAIPRNQVDQQLHRIMKMSRSDSLNKLSDKESQRVGLCRDSHRNLAEAGCSYSLSKREQEVERLLSEGTSLRKVGDTLGLSRQSVYTFKRRAAEKRGKLAGYILRQRIVDDELKHCQRKPEREILESCVANKLLVFAVREELLKDFHGLDICFV